MDDKARNERETALLEQMGRGIAQAIEEFYASYFQQFFCAAMRMTGDFHTAEDLAHDAVLKAIVHAGKYSPAMGTPKTWLFTILNRTVFDWMRRMKLRRATPLDKDGGSDDTPPMAATIPGREPTAQERLEVAERNAAIQAALMKLEDEQRALIVLRDLDGLSAPETAAILGITVKLVGGRLFRARRRFREVLEADWPELFRSREM